MPRRTLSDEDLAAWSDYARHVRTLAGRSPITPAPIRDTTPPAPSPIATETLPAPRPPRTRSHPITIGSQPPGLDTSTWTRFAAGRIAATRSLDLHGRTVHAAFAAFERFLATAHADRTRCVEVITGLGRNARGAIRTEFPIWLNLPSIRPLILAAAHPHAANPGSTRLLLRRSKP